MTRTSPYTAKHEGPAFDSRKLGTNVKHAPTEVHVRACPDCRRQTYITYTTDPRPPYDRVGCYWDGCRGTR